MKAPPVWQRIVDELTHCGPMTLDDLVAALGITRRHLDSAMRFSFKRHPEAFHISGYEVRIGRKGKAQPILKAGPGAHASRPKPQPKSVVNKRYEQRHAMVRRMRDNARSTAPTPLWLAVLGMR